MLKSKLVLAAVILRTLISFITGFVPNESVVSVPEIKLYGYPFFWLMINLNGSADYIATNLIMDIIFWIIISFFALFMINKVFTKLGIAIICKNLLLPIILFVTLGLLMDVIHEVWTWNLGDFSRWKAYVYADSILHLISKSGDNF